MASFHVYVVQLDPEAARKGASKRRLQTGGSAYYVGSTHLPVEARLRQHLAGKRGGNRVVRRWGRSIQMVCSFPSREAAEAFESAIAHQLAQRGNVVYQG